MNVLEPILETVRSRPDAPAVVAPDGSIVTYDQLWNKARALAATLDIARGETVAVSVPRSVAVLEAMLAVVMAGGVYCPLSPNDPPERFEQLRRRIGARTVLVPGADGGVEIVRHNHAPRVMPDMDDDAHRPLCIIWTSGSTGEPKAVVVADRGVVRLQHDQSFTRFNNDDRVALAANPTFDATTWEVWVTLGNGAAIVVIEHDELVDAGRLRARFERDAVTTTFLTTSLFNHLARTDPTMFGSLRTLMVGGEQLHPQEIGLVLRSASPPANILNGYGPTECTTFAVSHRITAPDCDQPRIPIGTPINATQLAIVDEHGQPVPPGKTGEIWLAGDGVALGYLDDEEGTHEKFVRATIGSFAETVWYRTGDLGRRNAAGLVECLGRMDRQFKILGFRIEPGEIEARLAAHPDVSAAAVVPVVKGNSTAIAGFVVPSRADIDVRAVLATLRDVLPANLVPTTLLQVDHIPLTANGKLDEQSLLARLHDAPDSTDDDEIPPRRPRKSEPFLAEVLDLIHEVLEDENVGQDDDMWEAGLDSLTAVEIIEALAEATGHYVRPNDFLVHRTPLHVARLLQTTNHQSRSSVVTFNEYGTRPPIYMVLGGATVALRLRLFAHELGRDQPLVVIESQGLHTSGRIDRRIESMAEYVAGVIIAQNPSQPVLLSGYSSGSIVAMHAAMLLEAKGMKVKVVLLDCTPLASTREEQAVDLGRRPPNTFRGAAERVLSPAYHRLRQMVVVPRFRGQRRDSRAYREFNWNAMVAVNKYRGRPRLAAPPTHLHTAASPGETSLRSVFPHMHSIEVGGDHISMLRNPHVASLARTFRSCFD